MDDLELTRQLDNLARYVTARVELLGKLRPGNRDPLVEWTERLVEILLDGELASSPVQKDWDVRVGEKLVCLAICGSPGMSVGEFRR